MDAVRQLRRLGFCSSDLSGLSGLGVVSLFLGVIRYQLKSGSSGMISFFFFFPNGFPLSGFFWRLSLLHRNSAFT